MARALTTSTSPHCSKPRFPARPTPLPRARWVADLAACRSAGRARQVGPHHLRGAISGCIGRPRRGATRPGERHRSHVSRRVVRGYLPHSRSVEVAGVELGDFGVGLLRSRSESMPIPSCGSIITVVFPEFRTGSLGRSWTDGEEHNTVPWRRVRDEPECADALLQLLAVPPRRGASGTIL